ncbi:glycosyltransferase family protein [Acuticoccus kandeliae]|uniref:glycosyltransferase family protein n=1 Tax=Acuticoccus kandeliae TaxID=2073160 RepID=UPI00196AD332|nr:glycosyltransferase [Acuticoccus kandeliae]
MTRVVIWVQHLLGTGHTVRAGAIAHALAAAGAEVTLVLGARPPATLDVAGLDLVELTPVAATDPSFRTIIGEDGTPYAALQAARRARFAETIAAKRPDAILVEAFPFGRGPFEGEIVPVLEALDRRVFVASSIRDVLVRKSPQKERVMTARARAHFDRIYVHADPAFVRLEDSFAAAGEVADLIDYTGFVHRPATAPAAPGGDGSDEVIVSAGGGAVGGALVEAALGAAALGPSRWRILVSPKMGEGRIAAWRAAAPENAVVEPNRPDFGALLARSALSVSQAGYNTVLDVLAAGTRAIFVPFAANEETEQTDRAEALARRGLARVLAENGLTAPMLAEAVDAALAEARPGPQPIDTKGAETTAARLLAEAGR